MATRLMQRRIKTPRLLLPATLLVTALTTASGLAAEEIPAPFGLQWGESPVRMEVLLTNSRARIVDRKLNADGEVWTVEGIKQQSLRRSVFHFRSNMLFEVELQYQSDDWDTDRYTNFMKQFRTRFDEKYGIGQLIARSNDTQGDVLQTLVGYRWTKSDTSIQLFFFEAQNTKQSYRTISIHYRKD
jgi:hypothetical protein